MDKQLSLPTLYKNGVDYQEEFMEHARRESLYKIIDYLDSPSSNQLRPITEQFFDEYYFRQYPNKKTEKIEKLLQKAILHSIEEEKKAQLRTKILYLLYKKVEPHICLIEGRAKIFPNETCNSIEKSIKYAFYVIEAITLGRPIEGIFKVPYDKICEITKCKWLYRCEEIEQFVLKNKVGTQYLKRIIQIVNDDNAVNLDAAFEQAKREAKIKREDIKTGNAMQRRHKHLKLKYKRLNEAYDMFLDKYKESEKLRRKFQRRSEKYSALNKELENNIKRLNKELKKLSKEKQINDNDKNPLMVMEIQDASSVLGVQSEFKEKQPSEAMTD